MGAFWPENTEPLREGPAEITDEDRQWWAFQPVHSVVAPNTDGDQWSKNDIDRFVLHRLSAESLTPARQLAANSGAAHPVLRFDRHAAVGGGFEVLC